MKPLLAGWVGYSPSLQAHILDLLLSRTDGPSQLVGAIERKEIPAAQIDATRNSHINVSSLQR